MSSCLFITSLICSRQLFEFWTTLQDMWLRLYTTKLAVAAAACGHAPAGAIVLLSAADFRQGELGVPNKQYRVTHHQSGHDSLDI